MGTEKKDLSGKYRELYKDTSRASKIVRSLSHVDNLRMLGGGLRFDISKACPGDTFKDEDRGNLELYRLDELTYDDKDKAPHKEALENVISTINITPGVNFFYLIMGREKNISIYYGVCRDYGDTNLENSDLKDISIGEIGRDILKSSIEGNFRGSRLSRVDVNKSKEDRSLLKKEEVLDFLDSFDYDHMRLMEGVPGVNEDDEKFQSVDRLIDVMGNDKFAMLLIAKPIALPQIEAIRDRVYNLYDELAPDSKKSISESYGENAGLNGDVSFSVQQPDLLNGDYSKRKSPEETVKQMEIPSGTGSFSVILRNSLSSAMGKSSGGSFDKPYNSVQHSVTSEIGSSKSESTTYTLSANSVTQGATRSESEGDSYTSGVSIEKTNKLVSDWTKYIEDVIFPRLDYGRGKGLFATSLVLFGESKTDVLKLENTVKAIYGSEEGNMMPMTSQKITDTMASYFKRFQIPRLSLSTEVSQMISEDALNIRTAASQYLIDTSRVIPGNWMSSKEVSLLAGVPRKEVPGISLREEVEFGLKTVEKDDSYRLGSIVKSGITTDSISVTLSRRDLNSHIFVTGVTGAGKTTTCQRILLESRRHFLVIEPAKTEYRILGKENKDMLVFTPGNEMSAPFRLNPFELVPGESITSRADMVKASIEASANLEAAIPQIIDKAIHLCYEDKGWDIATNKNYLYEDPFADGVYSFPTMSNLLDKAVEVVWNQGFDDRLRDEYIGSIRAYLGNLCVGTKGLMLDTPRSVKFESLLDRDVVIELENVGSPEDKTLIMGFILGNLNAAIKHRYAVLNRDLKDGEPEKRVEHITLIEEAHQLLSKTEPGDPRSKKLGVDSFANMLAEIRKYGESLIIADQIPNKLVSEVIKNTNTKIVHRIFAQDDKEAIGNTMALTTEQKDYLSNLDAGNAIVLSPGLKKAIHVKVDFDKNENDTSRNPLRDSALRDRVLEYYSSISSEGIMPGLNSLSTKPSKEQMEVYLATFHAQSAFWKEFAYLCRKTEDTPSKTFFEMEDNCLKVFSMGEMAKILSTLCMLRGNVKKLNEDLGDVPPGNLDEIVEGMIKSLDKYRDGLCKDKRSDRAYDKNSELYTLFCLE